MMTDTQICVPSAAIAAWRIEFETAEMLYRCARPQFMSKDAGAEMIRAFGLDAA